MFSVSAFLVAALTVAAPFDPKGGHIQGLCEGDRCYYLSQMTRLFKIDKQGACVKSVPVLSHTGDLCFKDGLLYTSVAVYDGPEKGKGKVQVFDADLNFIRETTFDRSLDGIAFYNGSLYVGQGSHLETVPHKKGEAPRSKTPHLENELLVLDPETLAVRARHVITHGNRTRYGIQNLTSVGTRLFATFYPGEPGAPDLVVYNADLRPLRRYVAGASNGLQFSTDENGAPCLVKCVTGVGKGKPISATIERIALKDGWPVAQFVGDSATGPSHEAATVTFK